MATRKNRRNKASKKSRNQRGEVVKVDTAKQLMEVDSNGNIIVLPVYSLSRKGKMGALAGLMAKRIVDIKESVIKGNKHPEYLHAVFTYYEDEAIALSEKFWDSEFLAIGGTSTSLMELIIEVDPVEFAIAVEDRVRETIASMNENSEQTIRSLSLAMFESDDAYAVDEVYDSGEVVDKRQIEVSKRV